MGNNLSTNLIATTGVSLGGLEIITDYLANMEMYEDDLAIVKEKVFGQEYHKKHYVKPVKPKKSIENIIDKFNIVKNVRTVRQDEIIESATLIKDDPDFDFSFDDETKAVSVEEISDDSDVLEANLLMQRIAQAQNSNNEFEIYDDENEDESEFEDTDDSTDVDGLIIEDNEDEYEDEIEDEGFDVDSLEFEDDDIDEDTDDDTDETDDDTDDEVDDELGDLNDIYDNLNKNNKPVQQEVKTQSVSKQQNDIDLDEDELEDSDDEDELEDLGDDVDSLGDDFDDEPDYEDELGDDIDSLGDDLDDELGDEQEADTFDIDSLGDDIDEPEDEDADNDEDSGFDIDSLGDELADEDNTDSLLQSNNIVKQEEKIEPQKNIEQYNDNSNNEEMKKMQQEVAAMREEIQRLKNNQSSKSTSNLEDKNKIKNVDLLDNLVETQEKTKKQLNSYEYYNGLSVDALYSKVKEYMINMGVSKRAIDISALNTKFGDMNIRKLIQKSYLIKIGSKGVTTGK